jgi:hypothetical protein
VSSSTGLVDHEALLLAWCYHDDKPFTGFQILLPSSFSLEVAPRGLCHMSKSACILSPGHSM